MPAHPESNRHTHKNLHCCRGNDDVQGELHSREKETSYKFEIGMIMDNCMADVLIQYELQSV